MLATRVASAAVFGPVLVIAAYLGGPLLWAVVAFIVVAGLIELDRLFRAMGQAAAPAPPVGGPAPAPGSRAWPPLTIPFGLGLVAAAILGRTDLVPVILTGVVLAAVFLPALWPGRIRAMDGVASVFAVAYLPWLASHFVLLRQLPGGMALLFTSFIGTWVFDAGSYFAGRSLGRHKLAPRVSPGKSVEGLVGGLVAGGVAITWLGLAWLRLPPLGAGVLALALMAAAQLGDLAESALKRQAGVKDSGTLIPGHGGILDRFDSLLGVVPVVYYLWVFWLGVAP